jgi:hypothetical protein
LVADANSLERCVVLNEAGKLLIRH